MTMKSVIFAVLVPIVVYGVNGYPDGFNSDFCTPPPNNGGKDFPKISNDYLAKMEWNDHVLRRSLYMSEYVSVTNNIGATYITGLKAPSVTTKYITSAPTGELFIIYDAEAQEFENGNCVVKKLDTTEEFALPFKNDPKYPGTDKLLSGKSLLTLGATPEGNLMYNGTEKVNGITCDVWLGCLYVPSGQITLTVKYHFSSDFWHAAGGSKPAPVQIYVTGYSKEDSNYQLEQTFNYAYFSTQWPSNNAKFFAVVFETPEHAYCAGRKDTYRLPAVPMHFGFRAEIIDNMAQTVMYTKEYYDFKSNYTRIDLKQPPTGNNTADSVVAPQTVINDFGTGVSYVIDKFTKDCTVIPITSSEFDSMGLSSGQTRMRTPSEFFDFEGTGQYPYQYMGEHLVRNIPCDGWISYRPYPSITSRLNATWEWYFATKATLIKAEDLVENLEPMRLVIKSAEAVVDVEYNFYRFSENQPDPRHFDVRTCYESAGSRIVNMQLTGNWTEYNAENNVQLLRYWVQLAVDAFTGLRSIRVQDIQFEFFGKDIGITFTLLGPAPIKGDTGNGVEQVPLELATNRLAEAFQSGVFQVYFMPNPLHVTIFQPVPNTLHIVDRKEDLNAYRPTNNNPGNTTNIVSVQTYGLDAGKSVGLAFGVLFLGAIIAIAGILVYRKFTTGAPYLVQHNDE